MLYNNTLIKKNKEPYIKRKKNDTKNVVPIANHTN